MGELWETGIQAWAVPMAVGAESGSGCVFTTTKSWTVTDACGNTGTATQTVSYTRDTTRPVITLAAAGAVVCKIGRASGRAEVEVSAVAEELKKRVAAAGA